MNQIKKLNSETSQRITFILGDYVAGVVAMIVFNILRYHWFVEVDYWDSLSQFVWSKLVVVGIFVMPAVSVVIFALSGFYVKTQVRSRIDLFTNTLVSTLMAALVIYFTLIVNDPIRERNVIFEIIGLIWLLFFVFVILTRLAIAKIIAVKVGDKQQGFNTLVIGATEAARQLVDRLNRSGVARNFNVLGYVRCHDFGRFDSDGLPVYELDELYSVCERLEIKQLILLPHPHGFNATMKLINKLFPTGCSIFISPSLFHVISGRTSIGDVKGEPLVDISQPNISPMTVALKRTFDIVVSSFALILLSPVMLGIAVAVKRDSKGPIFYCQERLGLHKRRFKIIKFRTMFTDAEAAGPALSSTDDPRVTKVGHVLRKYRLDELPQFWNVIRGEMSIVGPRPEREFYIDQIVKKVPFYTLVHGVRPGITSWGMVKYGYASDVEQMIERLNYDLLYIENISIGIDLKIIVYTVKTVVTGRGI